MTDTDATLALPRPRATAMAGARRAMGAQATALGGQMAAGLGNLGFALAAGRLLAPGEFAMLAAPRSSTTTGPS